MCCLSTKVGFEEKEDEFKSLATGLSKDFSPIPSRGEFFDSYFEDFKREEEELLDYRERDICHVGEGESRKIGVPREEFIQGIERNWKRRNRKVKEVEVNCNLEGKVAFKRGGLLEPTF
ncbi:unnamed protein product [Linum trigynum]|uniref:Uncharacterized protein n=1 Tax=Linum trigynum TaxID=586398 RepID=A0AAV2FEU8_9ROSI